MSIDPREHWIRQTKIGEKDEVDALRKVLDPKDVTGIKNRYIDFYLKHYLCKYLDPQPEDNLLDFGCGIGRLSEFMSPFVRSVYGVDVIDEFIDYCRAQPKKNRNTFYLKSCEADALRELGIDKLYVVWVLTYIFDNSEVINTLRVYKERLPNAKKGVVVEQVKRQRMYSKEPGAAPACYRTVDEYVDMFAQAGFGVRSYRILGERYNGPVYKLIHVTGNYLPTRLNKCSEKMFRIDQRQLGDCSRRTDLINDRKPTDVLFELEINPA